MTRHVKTILGDTGEVLAVRIGSPVGEGVTVAEAGERPWGVVASAGDAVAVWEESPPWLGLSLHVTAQNPIPKQDNITRPIPIPTSRTLSNRAIQNTPFTTLRGERQFPELHPQELSILLERGALLISNTQYQISNIP